MPWLKPRAHSLLVSTPATANQYLRSLLIKGGAAFTPGEISHTAGVKLSHFGTYQKLSVEPKRVKASQNTNER
jgi:hypothetical protein